MLRTVIADSAAKALEQIRREYGPQAVVVNVRRLPAEGLARLWQNPRIEVMVSVPEPLQAEANLGELRLRLAQVRGVKAEVRATPASLINHPVGAAPPASAPGQWPSPGLPPEEACGLRRWLEVSGLDPVHIQRVLDEVEAGMGGARADLKDELQSACRVLAGLWRWRYVPRSNTHVFVGPPGAGKTTVLGKWLTQSVLVEGRSAQVWRLDGAAANTAEGLSVVAEILGVGLERFEPEAAPPPSELVFVDLPGVNARDPEALADLGRRLERFPGAEIHLVLNAAYDSRVLVSQGRCYGALPITDVILTHLDEECGWGKLWNLMLGTNYTVTFLSAGQNLPGIFHSADPTGLLQASLPPE